MKKIIVFAFVVLVGLLIQGLWVGQAQAQSIGDFVIPVGGEVWPAGTAVNITVLDNVPLSTTFNPLDNYAFSYISISANGAGNSVQIKSDNIYGFSRIGTDKLGYSWMIPSSLTPGLYRISLKITLAPFTNILGENIVGATITSQSGIFSVTPPPVLKFIKGDRAEVIYAELNVRRAPSLEDSVRRDVGGCDSPYCKNAFRMAHMGDKGTITDGPVNKDGYIWWKVDYDGFADGWSIDGGLKKIGSYGGEAPPAQGGDFTLTAGQSVQKGGRLLVSWSGLCGDCTYHPVGAKAYLLGPYRNSIHPPVERLVGTIGVEIGIEGKTDYQIRQGDKNYATSLSASIPADVVDGVYVIKLVVDYNANGSDKNAISNIVSISGVTRPPVISSVEGPTSIKSGQTGTWKILATDPNSSALSYFVTWGDGTPTSYSAQPTLTHSYATEGTYPAVFQVVNTGKESDTKTVSMVVSNNDSPVISGVSGPTSLNVSQSGTWIVSASDSNGDTLSYSVVWGDNTSGAAQSESSFTHAYVTAGTYTATFTVNDGKGGSVSRNATITVVTPGTGYKITAPAGGEGWQQGTSHTIAWVTPMTPTVNVVQLYLVDGPTPVSIAVVKNGVPVNIQGGGDYIWTIPESVANGTYRVEALINTTDQTPTTIYSNNFNIGTVVTPGNSLPVISGVSGPTSLSVGQSGTWVVSASDSNGDTLSYNVVWGDGATGAAQSGSSFTHAYSTAGNYTARFTVSDGKGGSVYSDKIITVGSQTASSITIISPSSGDTWQMGETRTINWQVSNAGSVSAVNIDLIQMNDYARPFNVTIPIASNVPHTGSYSWTIPVISENSIIRDDPANGYIYKIKITSSNNTAITGSRVFNLVPGGTPGNSLPVISGVSGPTSLNVSQSGTWTVSASDSNGDTLSYSVAWGDGVTGAAQSGSSFTHAYSTAGTYTARFTVGDGKGGLANRDVVVTLLTAKFVAGDRVKNLFGLSNSSENCYVDPARTNYYLADYSGGWGISMGEAGTVIGGPYTHIGSYDWDTFNFWKVQFDNHAICWMRESSLEKGPPIISSTEFLIGARVKLIVGGNTIPSWTGLGLTGFKTGKGTIIGGPLGSGSDTKWNVDYDYGSDGWVAESKLQSIGIPTGKWAFGNDNILGRELNTSGGLVIDPYYTSVNYQVSIPSSMAQSSLPPAAVTAQAGSGGGWNCQGTYTGSMATNNFLGDSICRYERGNRAPQANLTGPASAFVGTMGTWHFTASDLEGALSSYKIDWGDGSGIIDGTLLGASVSKDVQHTFSKVGTFTIKLTVADGGGLTVAASLPVAVTDKTPACSTRFQIGDRVKVINTSTELPLKVRSSPEVTVVVDANRLGVHDNGEQGTIVGGPQSGSGYCWWKVDYDAGADGWSAEDWLTKAGTSVVTKTCGDINADGVVNQLDVTTLVNHIFSGASVPAGVSPDLNGDGVVDVFDQVALSDYLAGKAPAPTCEASSGGNDGRNTSRAITGPSSLTAGTNGTWQFTASDPSAQSLTYEIRWDDGQKTGPITVSGGSLSVSVSHSYSLAKYYLIEFNVVNNKGENNLELALVNVVGVGDRPANNSPILSAPTGPASVVVNTSVSWQVSATDSDSTSLSYTVIWGDGNQNTYTGASGQSVSISHTYTVTGSKTIQVTVSDGQSTDSKTLPINVTSTIGDGNPLLTINSFTGPGSIIQGGIGNWYFMATDPSGGAITCKIAWGDSIGVSYACSSGVVTKVIRSITNSAGIYTINLTVTNSRGDTATKPLSLVVQSGQGVPTGRVQIISPAGGEKWVAGQTYPIQWTAPASVSRVFIYAKPGGLLTPSGVVSVGGGTFNWIASAGVTQINIVAENNSVPEALSNVFTVSATSGSFKIGDNVKTKSSFSATVNVRQQPGATGEPAIIGSQPVGTAGTISGGPVYFAGSYNISPGWFWQVNFSSGVSGWLYEGVLELVQTGTVGGDQAISITSDSLNNPTMVFVGESNKWILKTNVPEAAGTLGSLSYEVDWGDQSPKYTFTDSSPYKVVTGTVNPIHIYTQPGNYTITAKVTSNGVVLATASGQGAGFTGSATKNLRVNVIYEPLKIVGFGVSSWAVGGNEMPKQFRTLASGGAPGSLTFNINWGDGTSDSSYTGTSGAVSLPAHNYLSISNWNPTLTVTDSMAQKVTKQLYNPALIKPPVISNITCPPTFTRAYILGYITCTFKIDSVSGGSIWYSIDWEGDGVVDYTTDAQGFLSGQTHTRSKSCSTSICSAGTWTTTIRARTVGAFPQWWSGPVNKTIIVN